MHERFNGLEDNELNWTNKKGLLSINAISASEGMCECIKGCKMLSFTDAVDSDYISYLINI